MEFLKSVKNEILNETKIAKSIIRLSREIIEKNNGTDEIYLVGIITRGKTLQKFTKTLQILQAITLVMELLILLSIEMTILIDSKL